MKKLSCRFLLMAIPLTLLVAASPGAAIAGEETISLKVLSAPLHAGRINPTLYGGFVELLDDHVPGMWAEMPGDRGFEGRAAIASSVPIAKAFGACSRPRPGTTSAASRTSATGIGTRAPTGATTPTGPSTTGNPAA